MSKIVVVSMAVTIATLCGSYAGAQTYPCKNVRFLVPAPAMLDLVGGHVSFMFDNLPTAYPHVKAGKIRALGVTATPRALIDRLYNDIAKILAMPDVRQKLEDQGADVVGSSPDQFTAHVKREIVKWAKVVKDSGARVE